MEEENEVITNERKGSYLFGTIGALLGGLITGAIASLAYIFMNLIVTIIVAPGVAFGYKICKGKMKKSAIWIIAIITVLITCAIVLIVGPKYYEYKYYVDLEYLYKNNVAELAYNGGLSLLFALLGVLVVKNMFNNDEDSYEESASTDKKYEAQTVGNDVLNKKQKDEVEKIRKVFENLNVFGKKDAIEEEKIIEGLTEQGFENPEKIFKKYRRFDIIKKYKGNYYFENKNTMYLSKSWWIWLIVIIVATVSNNMNDKTTTDNTYNDSTLKTKIESSTIADTYTIYNTNVKFQNPNNYVDITDEEDKEYQFGYYVQEAGFPEFSFNVYDKEEDITIEDLVAYTENSIKEAYQLSDDTKYNEVTIGDKTVYKMEFEQTLEDVTYKFYMYNFETESYFIAMYADCLEMQQNQAQKDFEKVISSLVEEN